MIYWFDQLLWFELKLTRFEDEEHEKSYELIRRRERKQQYIRDYTEEYCSITDSGNLVIQQRLHMVHWIMEVSDFAAVITI